VNNEQACEAFAVALSYLDLAKLKVDSASSRGINQSDTQYLKMLACSGQASNAKSSCLWDVKCGVRGKGLGLRVKVTMSKPLDPANVLDDVIELHVYIPNEETPIIDNMFSNIAIGTQAVKLMEISS
jgi:hypothetical protein